MNGSDDQSAELVMPFLPVASRGGPFDDHAYSAGYEMGLVDALLADNLAFGRQNRVIRAENREQADLLAMRHGWRATFYEYDNAPAWIGAEFVRITRENRPPPT